MDAVFMNGALRRKMEEEGRKAKKEVSAFPMLTPNKRRYQLLAISCASTLNTPQLSFETPLCVSAKQ